jgi:hypothetical protein
MQTDAQRIQCSQKHTHTHTKTLLQISAVVPKLSTVWGNFHKALEHLALREILFSQLVVKGLNQLWQTCFVNVYPYFCLFLAFCFIYV